jgi:lysozyme family protein
MTQSADPFPGLIDHAIGKEGGYSDHPDDAGGKTMWGITEARARAAGYRGAMRDMPRGTSVEIYRLFYWRQPGFDRISEIDPPIAARLLDIGINCGTGTAGKMLQRALNVLNDQGRHWPDLVVDGLCGGMTRAALQSHIGKRGADGRRVLLGMIAAQHSVYYLELAERKPSQEVFQWGWQLNRAIGAASVPGAYATAKTA